MSKNFLLKSIFAFLFLLICFYVISIMSGIITQYLNDNYIPFYFKLGKLIVPIMLIITLPSLCSYSGNNIKTSLFLLCLYTTIVSLMTSLFQEHSFSSMVSSCIPFIFPFISYLFGLNILKYVNRQFADLVIFVSFGIICFYYVYMMEVLFSSYSSNINIIIAYIPYLFFLLVLVNRNRNIVILSYILVFFILASSGKRGGLLALSLSSFFALFLSKSYSIKKIFSLACILLVVIFVSEDFIQSTKTINRILNSNDGDSGRSLIYSNVIDLYFSAAPLKMFFGHGANMVEKYTVSKMSAHNDFLQVLFDFGLVGFILYIGLYINLIKYVVDLRKVSSLYVFPIVVLVLTYFILAMVSHLFGYPYFFILTMALGYMQRLQHK